MHSLDKWQLDILAAEDTPADIELLQMALAPCGSEVNSLRIVFDGQEVVDYLQGEPTFDQPHRVVPNIILMDLKMPRMTGFEVLSWLRQHPHCSVIPVVIMSSSALPQDVRQGHRLGANAYFEKPTQFAQAGDPSQHHCIFVPCEAAARFRNAVPSIIAIVALRREAKRCAM